MRILRKKINKKKIFELNRKEEEEMKKAKKE